MQTDKQPSRKLTDIVGAPFMFELKGGEKLGLDDWTLYSEQWAAKQFGSMQQFYEIVFEIPTRKEVSEEDLKRAVNASVSIAAYQLDRDSRRKVKELKAVFTSEDEDIEAEMTTEEFLARNLKYNNFRVLCEAIMNMIKSSFPENWKELAKKKLEAQVNPNTRKK